MAVDVTNGILKQSDVRETITNTEETPVLFDLAYARFEGVASIAGGRGLFISPDGLELYTAHADDDILQYTMTKKWDVTTATLTHTLDVSAKETDLYGVWFKPDGSKMYTLGANGVSMDEYNLGTPWLLSSAIYLQEKDMAGLERLQPRGLYFREDGKQVYVSNNEATDRIDAWYLSTPWDVTTMSIIEFKSFGATLLKGISFNRSGSKLYFYGSTDDEYKLYDLSTVFKISSAAAATPADFKEFPLMTGPPRIFFNQNGSRLYLGNDTLIQQYSLKRGWR